MADDWQVAADCRPSDRGDADADTSAPAWRQNRTSFKNTKNTMQITATFSSVANRAGPVATATLPPVLEFPAFTLGAEEYGIDLQKRRQLRGYQTAAHIASAPALLKGAVHLRGIIVPIINMPITNLSILAQSLPVGKS